MSDKKKLNGKILVLVLAIICFGAFILFHNPATDVHTYPPPLHIPKHG